jgi:translation initiation factor 3 subunit K
VLAKALTQFPSPDFALCLHLLPAHILSPTASSAAALPAAGDAPLSEAVQKLNVLNQLLEQAQYTAFWKTLESDDLYADLTADVAGFEELMRVRIAVTVGQSCREVERSVLETWLHSKGAEFDRFVADICGWGVDNTRGGPGGTVVIPVNKENEAKGTVVRENVQFDRKWEWGIDGMQANFRQNSQG